MWSELSIWMKIWVIIWAPITIPLYFILDLFGLMW